MTFSVVAAHGIAPRNEVFEECWWIEIYHFGCNPILRIRDMNFLAINFVVVLDVILECSTYEV